MRNALLTFVFLFYSPAGEWSALQPLPEPVSNNAVASIVHKDRTLAFTFMGIGQKKTADAITRKAYVFDSRRNEWRSLPSVTGAGRIAASAVALNDQIFVIGGYTVDAAGKEVSVSNLDLYTPTAADPTEGYWSKGVPVPVAVDDSLAGVYQGRYIVLISGWSQQDNIADVQVYDTQRDRWRKGAPIIGTPVFGHAGAIVGSTIIYCGGAYKNPAWSKENGKPRYVVSDECWEGNIKSRATKIEWKRLPPHPGHAQYRMAAGVWGKRVVFSGGTDNPYNYDGVGYNGVPAEPSATTFVWNTGTHSWETLADNPSPTMDHRGMVADKTGLLIIGGMETGQKVTNRVSQLSPLK